MVSVASAPPHLHSPQLSEPPKASRRLFGSWALGCLLRRSSFTVSGESLELSCPVSASSLSFCFVLCPHQHLTCVCGELPPADPSPVYAASQLSPTPHLLQRPPTCPLSLCFWGVGHDREMKRTQLLIALSSFSSLFFLLLFFPHPSTSYWTQGLIRPHDHSSTSRLPASILLLVASSALASIFRMSSWWLLLPLSCGQGGPRVALHSLHHGWMLCTERGTTQCLFNWTQLCWKSEHLFSELPPTRLCYMTVHPCNVLQWQHLEGEQIRRTDLQKALCISPPRMGQVWFDVHNWGFFS